MLWFLFANTVTGEIEYNSWADTADNASFITGLANQLFNSTHTPTVNIFAANETLPDYCTAIQLKAVCPPDAGFA
ncbi:ANM_collapsed_G0054370.mRNA.1.CDS.1 [Saccharomyces cerevisiae]|nr:ANM_collapsed_G0054370.mRNA.1.CDS.1 [Saccharomyces cerevisiae]